MNQNINEGKFREVVLFSNVKLVRNIDNLPFCNKMTQEQLDVVNTIINNIYNHNEYLKTYLDFVNLSENSYKSNSIKQDMINNDYSNNTAYSSENNEINIIVNDIEHLTIKAKCLGLDLFRAFEICDNIDNIFDMSLDYAYDLKLGYLTSSPYDLGTALRANVILHLPALEQSGMMNRLCTTIEKMGLKISSIFSNSQTNGAIYKISNQLTLGITEKDSILNLDSIVRQIIDSEILARNNLIQNRIQIEDDIFRSLGILKYARSIGIDEFLNLYSKVRFGITSSLIDDIDLDEFDKLLNVISDIRLCNKDLDNLSLVEKDYIRAKIIREKLV